MDQPAGSPQPADPDEFEDFDPLFANDLMDMMFETMRPRANEDPERQVTRRKAALVALAALKQQDPLGMMFAAHAVASHHATMECFRRAMLATGDPSATSRMHKNAAMLSRMMAETVKDLACRGLNLGGKTP